VIHSFLAKGAFVLASRLNETKASCRPLAGFTAFALCFVSCAISTAQEAVFLSNVRQLTFDGKRAGESYFSADGSLMVFQSERDAKNPFFQIFLMDRETGDVERISPGMGKTTCAWIHPSNRKVLFA